MEKLPAFNHDKNKQNFPVYAVSSVHTNIAKYLEIVKYYNSFWIVVN